MEYQLIEETRKELNQLGNRKPLNDPDVVKLSQKLDGLLNEYQKLQCEKSLVIQEVVIVRKKIKNRIDEIIKCEFNLSQREFAAKIGENRTYLNRICNGEVEPGVLKGKK